MKKFAVAVLLCAILLALLFYRHLNAPPTTGSLIPKASPLALENDEPNENPNLKASPNVEPEGPTSKKVLANKSKTETLQFDLPKEHQVKLHLVQNIDELLKNAIKIELRSSSDDNTVTVTGLWRGEIKLNKKLTYLLIINRPWDYLTDEYIASSCIGIEEGGVSIYQKSLYNSLKFYEIKNRVGGKYVVSLVGVVGDKYVINVAIPESEETKTTNGFAYLRHGKKLQFLGLISLHRDTIYPKSECTDFEYKW